MCDNAACTCSFTDKPCDGYALNEQLEQVTVLIEDPVAKAEQAVADSGFKSVDAANPGVEVIHRGKFKSLTQQQRRWLKRR